MCVRWWRTHIRLGFRNHFLHYFMPVVFTAFMCERRTIPEVNQSIFNNEPAHVSSLELTYLVNCGSWYEVLLGRPGKASEAMKSSRLEGILPWSSLQSLNGSGVFLLLFQGINVGEALKQIVNYLVHRNPC